MPTALSSVRRGTSPRAGAGSWVAVAAGLVASTASTTALEGDLSFPLTVVGFVRGSRVVYEDRAPGLGYSVRYDGRGWKADVYVYDAGLGRIPDGPASPLAVRELDQAAREIQTAREQRLYRDAAERGPLHLRGPAAGRLACRAFDLVSREAVALDSILCITGSRGKFVKFRLSAAKGARRADAERFLAGWLPRL